MTTLPASRFAATALGIGLLLVLAACTGGAAPLAEPKIADVNACMDDAECVLVDEHICGGNTAINDAHLKTWQRFLEAKERSEGGRVVCAPSLPREWFEARCLNLACRALLKDERAYLEFSAKPSLDTPITLAFRFRAAADATNVRASVQIVPDGLNITNGNPEWQGSLQAVQDEAILLDLLASQMGYYQVKGLVEFEREGQRIWLEDTVDVETGAEGAVFGSKAVNAAIAAVAP